MSTQLQELLQPSGTTAAPVGLAVLFGGQGGNWLGELRAYYQEPALRRLVDECLDAVSEELSPARTGTALPQGFPVRKWLRETGSEPSSAELAHAPISVPMIFITQLAALHQLAQHGIPLADLIGLTRCATGQSQGLFTAVLLAHASDGRLDPQDIRRFTKYVFYMAARSQQVHPGGQGGDSAPMAVIVGLATGVLERLVRQHNARTDPERQVHISLRLSPERTVLSAHSGALARFARRNLAELEDRRAKLVYVRTSCPFHSSLLEPIRPLVEADLARLRFRCRGADLGFPVYSFFDGRNLQDDDEVSVPLYLDVIVRPLDWSTALSAAAADERVTHFLDFGPGIENKHITRAALAATGCGKPVISARALVRSR
jgi:malonyl CoA-acyl carrier protein transacylase